MFPLILTVLNGDYSAPYHNDPYEGLFVEHPKFQGLGLTRV